MGWTKWRKIAEGNSWFSDNFGDWEGPACYELAIAGPRGGDLTIVYVGETGDERRRLYEYASGVSHIEHLIRRALENGYALWYRGWACKSKEEARRMQDNLLARYGPQRYPWNTQFP